MEQGHRRFMGEQVKVLLKGHSEGILDRPPIEDMLGICKTRFYALCTNTALSQINSPSAIREPRRPGWLLLLCQGRGSCLIAWVAVLYPLYN